MPMPLQQRAFSPEPRHLRMTDCTTFHARPALRMSSRFGALLHFLLGSGVFVPVRQAPSGS